MPKYKIDERYYHTVPVTKGYFKESNIYICKKIVPGWFYNLIPVDKRRTQTRWYFTLFPETPCRLCDEGIIVKLPRNRRRTIVYRREEMEIYEWMYTDIGSYADEYNRPLGLHFTKGDFRKFPKFVKKTLVFIINQYNRNNIISKEEATELAKNELTETPKKKIYYIHTKPFTTIKKREPIISRKVRRIRKARKLKKIKEKENKFLKAIEEIEQKNEKRQKRVERNKLKQKKKKEKK